MLAIIGKLLLVLLVLTPLSAIIAVLCGVFGMGVVMLIGNDIAYGQDVGGGVAAIVISFVLIAVLSLLIRLIRFGRDSFSWGTFFLDIVVAPLRLPLIIITDIIALISLATGWEIVPREEPDFYYDGFWDTILMYLLMVEKDTFRYSVYGDDNLATPLYIFRVFMHQLITFVLTLIHSAPMIYFVFWHLPAYTEGKWDVWAPIIYVAVYIFTAIMSGTMKSIDFIGWDIGGTLDEYDRRKAKENAKLGLTFFEKYDRGGIKGVLPSWLGLIYILTGWFWFIPQALVLLLAIFFPKGKTATCILPKEIDLEFEDNFSGIKILYLFTGIVIDPDCPR